MKKWRLFSLFVIVLVLTACGSNSKEGASSENVGEESTEELTIKHQYGKAIVKKNPKKIVVFDFGVLDTLDDLGINVTGIPQATVPSYLKKYADEKYTNVGSLKEPDFEAIHELQPDVIFISARQAELYDQFADIAPTVYVGMDYTKYMESFESNMRLIGQIFGREEQMLRELKDINANVTEVKKKASAVDQKGLILLANEGKVSAFGSSSRFGIIHDVFGFGAADNKIEISTHGQSITFEYVMEKNPDVLFVIDRATAVGGKIGAKEIIENELVQNTKAYKNDKIVYLDADTWYLSGGGLKSMKAMTKEIAEAL